jgi:hypothetical protein
MGVRAPIRTFSRTDRAERLHELERPADTEAGDLVHREPGHVVAVDPTWPASGP